MAIKMYCIFSREALKKMNGNRGKMASQAGHAYLHAFWDSENRFPSYYGGLGGDYVSNTDKYRYSNLAFKITLVVDTDEELQVLAEKYRDKCGVSLVTDAGRTVFNEPTITCLGLGPVAEEELDEDIKSLKVLI